MSQLIQFKGFGTASKNGADTQKQTICYYFQYHSW